MGEIRDIGRKPRPDAHHLGASEEVVFCLQGGGTTSQNVNGSGWNADISFTLNALDVHGVCYEIHNPGASSE